MKVEKFLLSKFLLWWNFERSTEACFTDTADGKDTFDINAHRY